MFKKKNKAMMKSYYCKKCTRSVFVLSSDEFDEICTCCKQKMDFHGEFPYNPESAIKTIKNANQSKINNNSNINKGEQHEPSSPTVECPYCKSTATQKITATSKVVNTVVWGIFGTKRHKNYHCSNCKSDF